MSREKQYAEAVALMEVGKFDMAARQLAILASGSTDARFHAAYGNCLQKLGRWPESIRHFTAALALKPSYCEADWRIMLAESFVRCRRKERAIEEWRIVVTMEPAYPSYNGPIDEAKRQLEKFN
jgi:predicted Zn-dependent protease